VLFVLLVDRRKLLEWRLISCGAGLFLVGLLPYAYLPLRARMEPPLNIGDPSNWERFSNLVSGAGWQSSMFAFGPDELPDRLSMYLEHLSDQFHWAFLVAGIAGGIQLLARDRAAFALLGFLFSGVLLYALEYDIEDVRYYFVPTYLVLALFATSGLGALLRGTEALTRGDPEIRKAALAGLAGLAFALPMWDLGEAYRAVDRSADYEGRETIELVAREVEEDGLVVQHRSPLDYMRMVEGREDIGLRRFSGSLEEKVAWAEARDRPIYALIPEDFPTVAAMLRRLEGSGYNLIPVEENRLYEIVPQRSAVRT
jgi:hypothetical protein